MAFIWFIIHTELGDCMTILLFSRAKQDLYLQGQLIKPVPKILPWSMPCLTSTMEHRNKRTNNRQNILNTNLKQDQN